MTPARTIAVFVLAAALGAPPAMGQEVDLPPELDILQEVIEPKPEPAPSSAPQVPEPGPVPPAPPTSRTTSTIPGTEGQEIAQPPVDAPLVVNRATERALARLTNQARAEANLRPLRFFPRLAGIARRHSKKMAARGQLFHGLGRTAQRIRSWDWVSLGENVGVGASVESLQRAFMNSRPHRRNILRAPFRRVGIGMVGVNGRIWVTVIFYQ